MKVQLRSIKTIPEDFISRTGHTGQLNRTDIFRVAMDTIGKMELHEQYDHRIALLDVENYKTKLPKHFKKVIQAAYLEDVTRKVTYGQVVQFTQKAMDGSGCDLSISVDCPDCGSGSDTEVIIDTDRIWELTHPEYYYAHMKHFYRAGGRLDGSQALPNYSVYHEGFRLMRPAQDNFFGADYHIKGCLNLEPNVIGNETVEYIVQPPMMRVNFEKGKVLLSYLSVKVDDEGYPMIPDVPQVYEAVRWAIEEMVMYRMWRQTGSAHYQNLWANAKNEAVRKLAESRELLSTPEFDSWWAFVQNHWKRNRRYKDSWEKSNTFEGDTYDVPKF